MAWGYEKSFVVEHDNTLKKKISCSDCQYYDQSDKSCMKTPKYLPEDGYNSWKHCDFFKLDKNVSNYKEKNTQLKKHSKKNKQTQWVKADSPMKEKKKDIKEKTISSENVYIPKRSNVKGLSVYSQKYGNGIIQSIDKEKMMNIEFTDGSSRKFLYPLAFSSGAITIRKT